MALIYNARRVVFLEVCYELKHKYLAKRKVVKINITYLFNFAIRLENYNKKV